MSPKRKIEALTDDNSFLIRAPFAITMDESQPFINDVAILINDGKIVDIGQGSSLESKYRVINLKGKVIMPGFINIHTHFYSAFARGIKINGSQLSKFSKILEELWWKLDKSLDKESISLSAFMGVIDGVKAGVTTYFDHHSSPNDISNSLDIISDALNTVGVRSCLAYEVSDRDGIIKCDQGIAENVRFIKKCQQNHSDYNAGIFGLHASMTLSDYTLDIVSKSEKELNSGFHIHVAEGVEDVLDCTKKYGKRVVERLNDKGIINEKSILAHCVHLADNELKILNKSRCVVSHQSESNLNNAVGFASILRYMKEGIKVGIGTDGFAQTLFHSIRNVYLMPKFIHGDPRVSFNEVFKVLRENSNLASQVFGISLGVLSKGSAADIIALPYDPPTPITSDNILGHLMFGILESVVSDVICRGRYIMKDREILSVDETDIMKRCRDIAPKVWDIFKYK